MDILISKKKEKINKNNDYVKEVICRGYYLKVTFVQNVGDTPRRSTLPDRYVFELAEVRENGKGYGKAHHSGTEKKSYPVNTGDTRV